MSKPITIAPMSEPTNAPTIPPQKRSGRKIVKCQIANPIITQPSMPISAASRGSSVVRVRLGEGLCKSSARPPVPFVARAPTRLLTRLGGFLEHQILRGQVRRRIALGHALTAEILHRAVAVRRRAASIRDPRCRRLRALGDPRAIALARLI